MSTTVICQASPSQVERAKAKSQAECTMEDWELVSEASFNPNSEDNEATAGLWKKAKEGCMTARTAERRQKCEEEEQSVWAEAEQKAQEEAEWKKKEEEKAQRAEEAKQRAEEVTRAAEAQRRTAEGQHKPSIVIPAGGSLHRSTSGPSSGARAPCDRGKSTTCEACCKVKASCSWLKAAGGVTQKRRRTEAKEDDREDDEGDNEDDGKGDFMVPLALVQEHRDVLSALTMTLSALLKEFKGYHCEQWDLHTRQVKGLKALQREMRKANALKAKELKVTTKGKEKVTEVMEELSESGNEEEQAKGEGSKDRHGDRDIKMGAGPSASAT
ncbi:hypothetical protein ID866_11234 [Astraeus odoratus]|nr:hypothetical protein ID866_11234 [Astraeus odoratus]